MKTKLRVACLTGATFLALTLSSQAQATINLTDVLDKAGVTGGAPVTVLDTTHPDFDGIDDTFTGTVTFAVTIHYDAFTGADAYTGFVLANGGTETVALGNPWLQDYWGGYNNGNVAGPSGFFQIPGAANIDPVNEATGTYTMVIDYVAGGNDTGTVSLSGISGVTGDFTLAAADYSFDQIRVRNGDSAATTTVDFTDMSVVIPAPVAIAPMKLIMNGYNSVAGQVSLSVENIPSGDFHMRSSNDLLTFTPLSPALDFDSTTPQPFLIEVDPGGADPAALFYQVFDGISTP